MHNIMGVGVIQSLAGLARDVLQVPYGKALFAGQHGADTVALHVLHGRTKLAVNFFCPVKQRDVVAVERFCACGLVQNVLHQPSSLFCQHLQPYRFQRNRLSDPRVRGFVHSADL